MVDTQQLAAPLDLDVFRRRLNSGLYVPELDDSTAPIDVVDQHTPAPPAPSRVEQVRPVPPPKPVARQGIQEQPVPERRDEPAPAPVPTPPVAVAVPARAEPVAPNYWGRRGLIGVYWIAILTGAIGQVIFFGELFNLGLPGYFAAGIIATTAETIMVAAGDTAMDLRAKGRPVRQWVWFMAIAVTAALAASGMNLTHWWAKNPSMAVLFGGIAFLGFLLHVLHGLGEGTQYLAEKRAFDKQVTTARAEWQRQLEAEAAREAKEARAAAKTATAPAAASKPETGRVSQPKPAPRHAKASAKVTREEVLAWARRQPEVPGPAQVLAHFEAAKRELPTDRAVRNWLKELKTGG
ncbi:hypothetical protein [Amycolatopsis minnesotensis]|uniref:DUF2637 domain-containing protein n=1 Tax=Amycolatopsis minnesotensis TaxID=337894 RepID=A0ABN2SAU5_9PSEU